MDANWLLLFNREVSLLPEPLQRTLYAQFVEAVLEVDAGTMSDGAAAQAIAESFKQAVSARRAAGDERQLAVRLRELFKRNAAAYAAEGVRLGGGQTFGADAPLGDGHNYGGDARLGDGQDWKRAALEAWPEVSRFLLARRRRGRRAKTMLTAGLFAVMLLTGGVVFGTAPPSPVATAEEAAPAPSPPLPEGTAIPVQLTELKLTEQEMKKYASFRVLLPGFLPDGYKFEEGLEWLEDGKQKSDRAMLVYTNKDNHLLRISYYKMSKNSVLTTGVNMPESTEELFMRGSKALFVTTKDGFFQLSWSENETFIQLTGRMLDKSAVLKMAENLR